MTRPRATIDQVRRQTQSSRPTSSRGRRPSRQPRSSLTRRVLLLVAVIVAAGVVLGLVFAGSPTKIAEGVRIDGIDVGGLEATDARSLLERRSSALADRPVVFVAAGKRFRISPTTLGVEPDWKAAVDSAQRQGNGFGPLRGFRRIDVDFFGADVTPPTRVLDGALTYELKPDRQGRRPAEPQRRADAARDERRRRSRERRTRPRSRRSRRHDRRVARVADAAGRPGRAAAPRRDTPRARGRARAGGEAGTRRPVRPSRPPARTRSAGSCSRSGSRGCSRFPSGGTTALRIGGPAADAWLARLGKGVVAPPRNATFAASGSHVRVVPARPGVQLDALAAADAILTAASHRLADRRVAVLPVKEQPAKLSTAAAPGAGHRRRRLDVHDHLRRDRQPDPQRAAGRASRRRQADRAGRGVLVQQDDRRAHGGEGLPRGAGDHQRRGDHRSRRRRLPGLDHRLQRRVRGRAEDHRADESRALHQPLPAGPRRDRRLPGRRPPVRQRHRPLALPQDVRRLGRAHRHALRHADRTQGREHDHAARRARQGAGEEDGRSRR